MGIKRSKSYSKELFKFAKNHKSNDPETVAKDFMIYIEGQIKNFKNNDKTGSIKESSREA